MSAAVLAPPTQLKSLSCPEDMISDDSLRLLPNLHTLQTCGNRFTEAGLMCCTNLTTLKLRASDALTDVACAQLRKLQHLQLESAITCSDDAIAGLTALESLRLHYCSAPFTDRALQGLHRLRELSIHGDDQTFTADAFRGLSALYSLSLAGQSASTITDEAFSYLPQLRHLSISWQRQFTDAAFVHLTGL